MDDMTARWSLSAALVAGGVAGAIVMGCENVAADRAGQSGSKTADASSGQFADNELYGPERHATSEDELIPAWIAIRQFECFGEVRKAVEASIAAGEIPNFERRSEEYATRRSCVVAALCDVVDARPNYFAWNLQLYDSEVERAFTRTCHGVEDWGPEMMDAEPRLFAVAIRVRDRIRAELNAK